MPIYTRVGDSGETILNSGNCKIPKSDPIFKLLGIIDELNVALGFVATSRIHKINDVVEIIQKDLLKMGSVVSKYDTFDSKEGYFSSKVTYFENTIDSLEKELPQLKSFILPKGCFEACYLHSARVICRRFERILVPFKEFSYLIPYVNRLSDLLFTLARYANFKAGIEDSVSVN